MSAERWNRLAADLAAAGVEVVRVDERAYSESNYGRVRHGVSRSITIRRADGWLVEINDSWWHKNDAVWTGYTVTASDRGSITRSVRRGMKRRSEVVAAVLDATARKAVA